MQEKQKCHSKQISQCLPNIENMQITKDLPILTENLKTGLTGGRVKGSPKLIGLPHGGFGFVKLLNGKETTVAVNKQTGSLPIKPPMLTDSETQLIWTACDHRDHVRQNNSGKTKYAQRQEAYPGISNTDKRWLEIYVGIEAAARPMSDKEYMLLFAVMSTRLGIKQMSELEAEIFHNLDKQAYHDSNVSYLAAYRGFVDLLRTTPKMGFVPVPADVIEASFKHQRELTARRDALRDIFTNVERIELK